MPRFAPFYLLLLMSTAASAADGRRGDYSADVAPILARHCLECHGPDEAKREAGLRLDTRDGGLASLESGKVAIAPGKPKDSELLRRVASRGEDRMPPPDAKRLSADEVRILSTWIEQGANWAIHWAFTSPRRHAPPDVKLNGWVENEIDRFVLSSMEQAGRSPSPHARRRTLIRRLHLDVLGVPPRRADVEAFLNDRRPDAWARCVDRLLASPLYGQRWGRHWLDVARYGDSNGGDENHAYPLAWRYRNYVIRAMNHDLPFDQFVQEQIAGDLINMRANADDPRRGDRVTATGFLALGTKILAERDKVKMRADLVDEQVDTVGKSLLALTLGCARCHDHKFDPIPTADYYALAGVFHSTNLGDREVAGPATRKALAAYERRIAELDAKREQLQTTLKSLKGDFIERQAEQFDRGNVVIDKTNWGKGIGIISDPGAQQNFAEYDFQIEAPGEFLVELRYAAQNARPGRILINGEVAREKAIDKATGGWYPQHQKWFSEGAHPLKLGKNTLRVESSPLMSHIDRIRLIRVEESGKLAQALDAVKQLDDERARVQQQKPQPPRVMAASDGAASDTRIHIRGSHLELGDPAPRGFPSAVSAMEEKAEIAGAESGRMQLAEWLTDLPRGAGGQTARVIANRLWHWHFGRGLIATPNDFGMRGGRPTHPQLLDWLALELIESDWSLKSLHRMILMSATYQQRANMQPRPLDAELYVGFLPRRVDAETLRDAILRMADNLDERLVGEPLTVKSQDPSPTDLANNEMAYRRFRRRSVYLPVVRSNVYRFLTLFDFPNAATPVGRRDSTTTPTQALVLLNDPFVMDQCEAIAKRLIEESPTADVRERLNWLYVRAYSRPPREAELTSAARFLARYRATLEDSDQLQAEHAAWAALCQVVLQSNEFAYVD